MGIAGGVLAVVLGALVYVWYRQRLSRSDDNRENAYLNHDLGQQRLALGNKAPVFDRPQSQPDPWKDDAILTRRIHRGAVETQRLLGRGGYGEVYEGVYNGQRVAVKMLPDERRANLQTLLSGYETANHPIGIDREKATIALHVCRALTYLHTLSTPVIHRDVKSRNILLNHEMNNHEMKAKLIDFGISRERLEETLTAGVGTSLWMAPEVMQGARYDEKVDMFSFGVVLSELDVHRRPHSHQRDAHGRRRPDAYLLRQIESGELRVEFSQQSPPSITELGELCVSLNPELRPTGQEAHDILEQALARELD
ncbi:hypothetical protein JG688_00013400 [Phytophthora aleatoria]|uniref:Protein kinase domain-containing protein n=1 Tax=Phytophthora aleatoria TaxID=2496075 RepID=A0A8J5LYK5_9STRA|nr:hypothetical protein JG688_00013400 [Phytophthora aleatoria]